MYSDAERIDSRGGLQNGIQFNATKLILSSAEFNTSAGNIIKKRDLVPKRQMVNILYPCDTIKDGSQTELLKQWANSHPIDREGSKIVAHIPNSGIYPLFLFLWKTTDMFAVRCAQVSVRLITGTHIYTRPCGAVVTSYQVR